MVGLVRRVALCAVMIFFTENMISAETVTLSTIMPASAAGVKRVWQGTVTITYVPMSLTPTTYTVSFSSPNQPKKDKSVITVTGGGLSYDSDRFGEKTSYWWCFNLDSIGTTGDYISSLTILAPASRSGVATYTVIEYQ